MSAPDISLLIACDCEATGHAIADAKLGQRATRGLAELAAAQRLKLTMFVLPTDLEAHGALYRELEKAGHEVGLHVHPKEQGWGEFMGVYGPDDQRKIMVEAVDRFAQVMGRRPLSVCMGYASANDSSYPVLCESGFTHGHLSIPTRVLPECASVWAGAPLDIHYAHPYNRLLPGWLDFVEVPQTLDPESRMWGGKHPQDLRVELVDAKNHWYTTHKAVARQMQAGTPVKQVHIVTHNIFAFDEPSDFRRVTIEGMIRHARTIVEQAGARLTPRTVAEVAALYRQACPRPAPGSMTLILDTKGRQ